MAWAPAQLFWSFAKLGAVGYGGGPAMMPLFQAECARRGWLTEQQFADGLAAGYSLPGPISTKMAFWIGWEVAGLPGAAAALLGVLLPSLLLIALVFGLLRTYADHPRVAGLLQGVRPIVLALLVSMVVDLAPKATPGPWPVAVALAAFVALRVSGWHPAWFIALGALAGALLMPGVNR